MLRYSICRCVYLSMSKTKKRNRNIQSLSSLGQFNFLNYPSPDNCISNNHDSLRNKEDLFGELVKEEYSPPFYKLEYDPSETHISPPFYKSKWKSRGTPRTTLDDIIDTESITSGISEIKLIKSLSSSPSWSDDNDNDGSRRVQDELERMDRVLRGIDPIPVQYDMDEYKQWMETFPNLSLFGQKECGPYKIWKNERECDPANNLSDVTDSSFKSDKYLTRNLEQYKEEIKKAVIHNIYENISIRLNNGSPPATPDGRLKKSSHVGEVSKSYLSDCLKNSPFTRVIQDRYKKNCFISRHSSQEDTVEESLKFESLPLMFEEPNKNIEPTFSKHKNDSLNSLGRRKSRRSIVLPPIESKSLRSSNQFRSISATPTYSSLLSAKAMKLESKLLSGKSRNVPQF